MLNLDKKKIVFPRIMIYPKMWIKTLLAYSQNHIQTLNVFHTNYMYLYDYKALRNKEKKPPVLVGGNPT